MKCGSSLGLPLFTDNALLMAGNVREFDIEHIKETLAEVCTYITSKESADIHMLGSQARLPELLSDHRAERRSRSRGVFIER